MAGADLICTVTTASEPVVRGEWVSPGRPHQRRGRLLTAPRASWTRRWSSRPACTPTGASRCSTRPASSSSPRRGPHRRRPHRGRDRRGALGQGRRPHLAGRDHAVQVARHRHRGPGRGAPCLRQRRRSAAWGSGWRSAAGTSPRRAAPEAARVRRGRRGVRRGARASRPLAAALPLASRTTPSSRSSRSCADHSSASRMSAPALWASLHMMASAMGRCSTPNSWPARAANPKGCASRWRPTSRRRLRGCCSRRPAAASCPRPRPRRCGTASRWRATSGSSRPFPRRWRRWPAPPGGAPLRRQERRRRLHRQAELVAGPDVPVAGQHLRRQAPFVARLVGDEGAARSAQTRLHQLLVVERADGHADGIAAHAQRLGEVAFRGQTLARRHGAQGDEPASESATRAEEGRGRRGTSSTLGRLPLMSSLCIPSPAFPAPPRLPVFHARAAEQSLASPRPARWRCPLKLSLTAGGRLWQVL